MKPTLLALCLASAALFSSPSGAEDDEARIGYINKMGDHPWFVAEVTGARETAEKAGAVFLVQDVQFNADLTITTLDTMIGDGVDGIAIVVPDRALGPVVAARAAKAGVPLIAVDDDIQFEDGTQVPYVGIDSYSIGQRVGEALAEIYEREGWSEHEVKVASIEDRRADTCMQRNKGAEDTLLEAASGLTKDDVVRVAYDNTMVNAIDVMTTTLTANPATTHWSFYSCNDDGVLGAARALENSGYGPEQGMGIGIDGSRICDAFGNDRQSAYRGSMWLNSYNHGAIAVKLLIDAIRNDAELPKRTFSDPEYINFDNFGEYRDRLCS